MSTPGRAVILGASGFLGRAICGELSCRGVEVVAHSSGTVDLLRPDTLGALDPALDSETSLVFASALTPDRGQSASTFMANAAMAANLAAYLERRRLGQVVYVGSDAVYGFDHSPVTEDTPVAPAGYYAIGKYAGERVMECAARAIAAPLLVLRVTGVYGPGDPHGSYGPNGFARSLARDRTVRMFGAGEEERDHVYIDDVARVTSDFVQNGTTGVFNVATGQSWSFGELIKVIRDLVPYPVEVTSVPRKGAITHRRFDVSRLTRTLPELRFTALREGLRTTLAAAGALPDA